MKHCTAHIEMEAVDDRHAKRGHAVAVLCSGERLATNKYPTAQTFCKFILQPLYPTLIQPRRCMHHVVRSIAVARLAPAVNRPGYKIDAVNYAHNSDDFVPQR